jgi:hypothetical protein
MAILRLTARLAPLLFALAVCGCTMGQPCERSSDCAGGACIKGACSAYACEGDTDCSGDFVCGAVLDARVCVLHCELDDDCPGRQSCWNVAESTDDDSVRNDVCM